MSQLVWDAADSFLWGSCLWLLFFPLYFDDPVESLGSHSKQCLFLSASGLTWISPNDGYIGFVLLMGNLLVCDPDPLSVLSSVPSAVFTESFPEPGTVAGARGTDTVLVVSLLALSCGFADVVMMGGKFG